MADGNTPTYNLILPEIDGADGTWGISLNSNLGSLDSLLSGATALSAITVTGTVTAGGVTLGNNQIIKLGGDASPNLEIFESTGGDAVIRQVGTGNIAIQGQNGYLQNDAGNALVAWDADHSEISWQGATGAGIKLATTETGIDVTGTVDLDNLTIATDQGTAGQVLKSTGSGIEWGSDSGGSETLAQTLALGNATGGTDIVLTDGDVITGTANPVIKPPAPYTGYGSPSIELQTSSGIARISTTEIEAKLWYGATGAQSALKLQTTDAGIDVTGTVKGDSLTIDNGAGLTTAYINSATGASILTVKSTYEGGTEWQNVGVIEVGGHDKAYIDLKKPDTDDTDLRLLHDGNGSLTAFDGDLFLQTSSSNSSGKVGLRNGGSTKLETTATGINVTGDLDVTGTITSNAFAYSKATVNNAADILYTAFNSFAGKRIINTASATATTYGLPTPVAADIGKSWIICNPTDSEITIDHDASGTANYIWIMDGVTLSAAASSWTIKKGAVVEIVVAAAAAGGGSSTAPNYLIFGAGLLEIV